MAIPHSLPSTIFQSRRESTSSEEDSSSDKDGGSTVLNPTFLTTAGQRTRINMFGITNTEYTQTTIIDPVLYIALYSTGDAPSEVDDYHWTFIVGPSHEEADSKGTLYNMEPRRAPDYTRPYGVGGIEWAWLYNQPTVPLRGQHGLLARLMIAEVADMNMLQAIMLRWGEKKSMRTHVDWMSVRWVKDVLKSLDEDEGCLGRRMESFDGIEAEGRWLAETEEEKRKGYCLLDTRVSTRILFERERATALLSTATVDIAIKYPVLYVAVYKKDRSPHENDDYHWAFLIGPSNETAESEGVCCCVELQLDSHGRPTWDYNQTIVPLRGEDDLLARMLIADVVDLGPLGEIIRDHDLTPTTERTDSIAEGLESSSLAWVREKLEMLERKPECFAYKCHDFGVFERVGRELAGEQGKKVARPFGVEGRTRSLVYGWKKPDEYENKVVVKLNLARGETNTISRAVQIATGVLGAAAFETRRQVAEREKREMKDEQKGEAHVGSKDSEEATTLAERQKTQGIGGGKSVGNEGDGGNGASTRPKGARITTTSFAKLHIPEEISEEEKDEDETETETETEEDDDGDDEDKDENGEDEDEDEEDENEDEAAKVVGEKNIREETANARPEDVRRTSTVQFVIPNKPEKGTGENNVAKEDEGRKDETESAESGEEEDEDEDEGDETQSEEHEDEEGEDEEGEDEEGEDEEGEDEEGETESKGNEDEEDEDEEGETESEENEDEEGEDEEGETESEENEDEEDEDEEKE